MWRYYADINATGRTSWRVVQRIDESVGRSGHYQWCRLQEINNYFRKNSSSEMKFHRTDTLFIYVIKRSTDDKDEDWFIGNSNDYNNWKKKINKR